VPLDELPVDDVAAALAEQRVGVRVDEVLIRAEEDQVLEVPDPGHQVEPEQGREGEDRRRLPLRVRMNGRGLDVGLVGQQALDQVHRLPHPARNESGEQRNVSV
jgi:hypothetical protein